jgi:hypothetical protein
MQPAPRKNFGLPSLCMMGAGGLASSRFPMAWFGDKIPEFGARTASGRGGKSLTKGKRLRTDGICREMARSVRFVRPTPSRSGSWTWVGPS